MDEMVLSVKTTNIIQTKKQNKYTHTKQYTAFMIWDLCAYAGFNIPIWNCASNGFMVPASNSLLSHPMEMGAGIGMAGMGMEIER